MLVANESALEDADVWCVELIDLMTIGAIMRNSVASHDVRGSLKTHESSKLRKWRLPYFSLFFLFNHTDEPTAERNGTGVE